MPVMNWMVRSRRAEAGVGDGAVAAQVEVPPIVLLAEVVVAHALEKHVEAFLALEPPMISPILGRGRPWRRRSAIGGQPSSRRM